MAISSWSTTAGNNDTADATINWQENQAPSTVNNSARAMMAATRTWYEDVEWRDFGHSVTRTGATTFTIGSDVTTTYVANRPIRCEDSSTLYGFIASSVYSSPNTTVTVTLDSGSLSASLSSVALGVTPSTQSIPVQAIRNQGSALLGASNVWTASNTLSIDDATTNDVTTAYTFRHTTSGTPANNIGVGIDFAAETSASNNEIGAQIEAVAVDTTSTSEDFEIHLNTMKAGAAATTALKIGQGAYTPSATGGDKGANTINASNIYDDGVKVGGFGISGETWQDVSGSRTSGTEYQNTSGVPIMVAVTTSSTSVNGATVSIAALVGSASPPTLTAVNTGHSHGSSSGNANFSACFIVPNNWYYKVTVTTATVSTWIELRP